jgi:tetratricopeptide (TPR) repeat protein
MIKQRLFIIALSLYAFSSKAQSYDKEKITGFFQNQQFEDAIDYLNPFYLIDSNNLQILNDLGYANYMDDNRQKAAVYFEKILRTDSNNIAANQYLANINISNNHLLAAGIFVRRLIRAAPRRASYYRILGSIYTKGLEKDSAVMYYQYAYQLTPNDSKNIMAYAESLINDSNYIRADSVLYAGLKTDSFNVSYLKLLIQSSYDSKNFQGIIAPGEKLIDLDELSIKILPKLAFAYFILNRFKECIRVCEIMDSNSLAGESTYYYEARSWSKLNKFSLSNELLEKCLGYSISKTSELYYFNLAENNESLGNYKMAISNYDTAYYLFKSPVMIYRCGRIYDEYLKNPARAKFYYSKYLRIAHPVNAGDRRLYDYIRSRCLELK